MALCVKCKIELPGGAIFCHMCGKKQSAQKKRKKKRPDHLGTVEKLEGREKPYRVRLARSIDKSRPTVGYYKTPQEAEAALMLAATQKRPERTNLTLGDLWEEFKISEYYDQLSRQGKESHIKAWKRLCVIKDTKVSDVATDTFQTIIRGMTYEKKVKEDLPGGKTKITKITVACSRETKAKVRNLASLLCKEAMRLRVMDKNYGALAQLPRADSKPGIPFSAADQEKLWGLAEDDNAPKADRDTARIILLMCNLGTRPSELFLLDVESLREGPPDYFIGGIKTDAGMERVIIIPPIVLPFVLYFKGDRESGPIFLGERKARLTINNWRNKRFNPLRDKLGLNPRCTPKSGRTTFATKHKRRGVDPETMMDVMGHEDYATAVEHYHTLTEDDILMLYNAFKDTKKDD